MTALNPYGAPGATVGTGEQPHKGVSYRTLWSTAFVALVLFVFMGIQASFIGALTLAMLIVPGQTVLLAVAFLRRKREEGAIRLRLLKSGIYGVMLVALFLYAGFEHGIARAHANQIVEACHSYEKDHGHLPENLSVLVPNYLPTLRQGLGLIAKRYYYYSPPEEESPARFMYQQEMFRRSWYDFETRRWAP